MFRLFAERTCACCETRWVEESSSSNECLSLDQSNLWSRSEKDCGQAAKRRKKERDRQTDRENESERERMREGEREIDRQGDKYSAARWRDKRETTFLDAEMPAPLGHSHTQGTKCLSGFVF